MIELRWYSTDNKSRTLQYRQRIDTTIRAGMWSNEDLARTANYQWSDWADVPEVHNTPTYSVTNKCPRCMMELTGPVGYVCPVTNCPSGLGSSTS